MRSKQKLNRPTCLNQDEIDDLGIDDALDLCTHCPPDFKELMISERRCSNPAITFTPTEGVTFERLSKIYRETLQALRNKSGEP